MSLEAFEDRKTIAKIAAMAEELRDRLQGGKRSLVLLCSSSRDHVRYGRLFHWVFEWDRETGFMADRINYGPIDVTACSWIVPGTILEEEPYSEEEDNEL